VAAPESSAHRRLWRRIAGFPRTKPGWLAVALSVVIFGSLIVAARYNLHAFPLIYLLGCLEVAGFVTTLVAIGKGERSLLIFVALTFYLVLLLNFLGALIS
jgi:hypothetical protein